MTALELEMGKHDATTLSKPLTSLQITPPSIHPAQVQQVILVSGKARAEQPVIVCGVQSEESIDGNQLVLYNNNDFNPHMVIPLPGHS